nr:immunoglobulin heavy chain junction region [Mus musculus]
AYMQLSSLTSEDSTV